MMLTCNSFQSRNMSLGAELGKGRPLDEILAERKTVAEGVWTAAAVADLARRLKVDMPICQGMNRVLHHGLGVTEMIDGLLSRRFREE